MLRRDQATELLQVLEGDYLAAMLYGSVARGDSGPDSDIDLLQVVANRTEHYQRGLVSVAVYTVCDIRRMCESGSVFALHLVSEGVVISDDGSLREALSAYRTPPSYAPMWSEIAAAALILDAGPAVVAANPIGLVRLGLYLLRTAAIIRHVETHGVPCFAIPDLAKNLEIPGLVGAFSERQDPSRLDAGRLATVRDLLEELAGVRIVNPYESLEALAVNLDAPHPTAARLALRLLEGEITLGYGDLLLDPILPPDV